MGTISTVETKVVTIMMMMLNGFSRAPPPREKLPKPFVHICPLLPLPMDMGMNTGEDRASCLTPASASSSEYHYTRLRAALRNLLQLGDSRQTGSQAERDASAGTRMCSSQRSRAHAVPSQDSPESHTLPLPSFSLH